MEWTDLTQLYTKKLDRVWAVSKRTLLISFWNQAFPDRWISDGMILNKPHLLMRPCDWNVLINAETNQYWTDWDCFPKAWLLIVYWLFLSDQMFFCKLSWSVLIVSKFRVNVLLRASARLFTVQLVLKSDAQRRTGSYLQSNWRAAEPWRLHLQPAPQTSRTFRSRIFPQNASVSGSSCSRAAGCHSFVWPPVEPRVRLRAVTQFGDILRDRLFLRPLAACLFSCLSVCLSLRSFGGT